ncbi:tail fiber domain-containing protein [Gluconobacter albidus]|uniref:tail fiber domain-containing protein n=1 Tax=Gluconobacter albidus TaxID=318683 RepID=UPI0009E7F0D3|nr:tail fiber domain-containing protein [Gluconobacter albidus]
MSSDIAMVSTPKAPDPTQTAQAQAEYNQNTATTQQLLNMTNQVTPYGTLTYNQTGNSTFTGADGKTYTVPQYTQTTTLNPEQQATLNQTQSAANNIAQTANSLSGSGLSSLGQAVDTSGAPALQTSLGSGYSSSPGSSYSTSLGSNYTTGLGSDYNTSFGGDVSQAMTNAKNAVMDQYTPTLDRNSEATRAQEIASGIRPGSAAYTANEQTIGDNYTRAADQATLTGQSVQNQLFNQQQQQAAYTDSALLNQAQFGNESALNQLNAQNNASLTGQQFTNSALLNNANFDNSANSQWLQNYYTQRDQPLNELSALLSGSQVSNATTGASSTPQTSVAGVDYTGLVNNEYQDQLQNSNSMLSGISGIVGGLGSAALTKYSDRRLKTGICLLKRFANGLGLYSYRYKSAPDQAETGFMADEVEHVCPDAVSRDQRGFAMVNYDRVLREAF